MSVKLLDPEVIKNEFPIFSSRKELIYLDTAATSQKPKRVIDALTKYYLEDYATVHRAIYELSMEATDLYDEVREAVKSFIGADSEEEIIFTRGTTDSINLVKNSFVKQHLKRGDEILISEGEHHSNIVPWQMLRDEIGCILKVIPINERSEILLDEYEKLLTPKVKFVSIAHVFNSTGTINPVKEMISLAHKMGAYVLVDGAQAAAHIPVDVTLLNADFYAFSGHKAYGPTGVGILYGKKELLEKMTPSIGGGDMVDKVTFEKTTYQKPPLCFEAGTPMIASVIGLGEAIRFIEEIGLSEIQKEEERLTACLTKRLLEIPALTILGNAKKKTGIISFTVEGVHPLDIGTFLDLKGIAIRTGHHCAQPLLAKFGVTASARVSLGVYTTQKDLDRFIISLVDVIEHLR